jgi:molybdenum-dependent DNA-binding transcriptional regulator ModE
VVHPCIRQAIYPCKHIARGARKLIRAGAGACLTHTGEQVLARYTRMRLAATKAVAADLAALRRYLPVR